MVGRTAIEARGMTKAVIRSLCLFALVISIAVRVQANQVRTEMLTDFDIVAAVADVIREQGYALRENPVKPPKVLADVVYFQRPGCNQASFVFPYQISMEALALLTRVDKPEFGHRYFYMDRSWDEQNRVAMVLQWVKYTVLDILGASPYVPFKKAIILADPPGCTSPAAIDWRSVWAKNRFVKAANGGVNQHAGS
jgi:hypothetical protein